MDVYTSDGRYLRRRRQGARQRARVRGNITRVVTSPVKFKGYTVHASRDEPQYEIKSDTTDHIAMHNGAALTKLRT